MGETYTAADLLCSAPYIWYKDYLQNDPLIEDWVARCVARPARVKVLADEEARGAKAAA